MGVSVSLRKFVVPEIVFGAGALDAVGKYAAAFGLQRPLIVSDPGVCAAGWTQRVLDQVRAAKADPTVFTQITPNPKDHEVMAGAEAYLAAHCDGIIAVGGGSVLDTAKGIGIVTMNGGHILDYEGVDTIAVPIPPLICIPTTAGSAADISQFAIITDTRRRTKTAIISKAIVPDVALVDPCTLKPLPPDLTAATGMDVLAHAVEAYVSQASSPLTDVHALEAARRIVQALPQAVADPRHVEARTHTMLASLHAGMAFSNASLGAVHALAHSLGGFLDLPHGECNALLLPPVVAFNFPAAPHKFRRLAHEMGVDLHGMDDASAAKFLEDHLTRLRAELDIIGGLAERGVHREDIGHLAHIALQDPCLVTNPRPATGTDLEAIYARIL